MVSNINKMIWKYCENDIRILVAAINRERKMIKT